MRLLHTKQIQNKGEKAMLKRKLKILVVSLLVLITLTSYYFIKEADEFNKKSVETNITNSKENANEKLKQVQEENLIQENTLNKEDSTLENTENEGTAVVQEEVIEETKPEQTTIYEIKVCNTEETHEEKSTSNNVEDYIQKEYYKCIDNEANADKHFVDSVVSQMSLLPNETVERFMNEGKRVCITNVNLKEKLNESDKEKVQDDSITTGLIDYSEGIIYLLYNDLTIQTYTTIHEFGHYTDEMLGWVSSEPEFETIYNSEKYIINTDVEIINEKEMYAEAYKRVILKQDTENLEAYKYVKESLKNPILLQFSN